MNIAEAFAQYIEDLGMATLGQDLFIGQAPSTNTTQNNLWWLVASGGTKTLDAKTGEAMKQYTIDIYLRNRDARAIYDTIFELEELINADGCTQLIGFDTVDVEAITFPTDEDLDLEDRKIGLLQVTITTYKEFNNGIS